MIFSMYNNKTNRFGRLFEAEDCETAIFAMEERLRRGLDFPDDQKDEFIMFPDEFTLYKVGEFDKDTGLLSGASIESIFTGIQCVKYVKDFYKKQKELWKGVNDDSGNKECCFVENSDDSGQSS